MYVSVCVIVRLYVCVCLNISVWCESVIVHVCLIVQDCVWLQACDCQIAHWSIMPRLQMVGDFQDVCVCSSTYLWHLPVMVCDDSSQRSYTDTVTHQVHILTEKIFHPANTHRDTLTSIWNHTLEYKLTTNFKISNY